MAGYSEVIESLGRVGRRRAMNAPRTASRARQKRGHGREWRKQKLETRKQKLERENRKSQTRTLNSERHAQLAFVDREGPKFGTAFTLENARWHSIPS